MVNHICTICLKNFSRKSDFIYHIEKKKKPCVQKYQVPPETLQDPPENLQNPPKNLQDPPVNTIFCCEFCKQTFKRKDNLKRHLDNRCKKKLEHDINDESDSDKDIRKENKELKKEIEELKKMFYEFQKNNKINTQNNIETQNNNTTNNTQNNNINIILPHGEELKKVELGDVLDQMLTYDFHKMVPNLVKHIYLNKDKPENQNFVVNDMARNKCQYYDGKKWITGKTSDKLLGIFENTNSLFVDPFNEPEAIKTVKFIRKNKKYSEKYATILKCRKFAKSLFDEWDKDSMDTRQQLLDELKLIFYNHRDEILKIK